MRNCRKIIELACAGGIVLAILAGLAMFGPVGAAEEAKDEAEALPAYTREGADSCLSCHGDEESAHLMVIFEGPHGVRGDDRTPFGGNQCEACHGPGGDHAARVRFGQERPPMPAFGPNSPWSEARENETCLGCHREQRHEWDGGVHQSQELACTDCHSVHTRRDAVMVTSTQPQVCLDCHVEQRAQVHRAYGHPIRFGEMGCTDCHEPHGGLNEAMLTSPTINQNCFQCHAEMRGPYLWEHAPVTEDCTLCHQAHGSNNPAMLTRRAPLLCQQCHSRMGHPSIGRTGDDLPTGRPSPFLLSGSCMNCHSQVHGSNHPSGAILNR